MPSGAGTAAAANRNKFQICSRLGLFCSPFAIMCLYSISRPTGRSPGQNSSQRESASRSPLERAAIQRSVLYETTGYKIVDHELHVLGNDGTLVILTRLVEQCNCYRKRKCIANVQPDYFRLTNLCFRANTSSPEKR
jgi:hypothetical protein